MIFEFFIFIIICILYFFIYINMKINKNNEIYLLDQEPTRYNITKESYLKLPFYFNGTHLNQKINKKELILLEEKDKYYKYKKNYEKIHLLEPYIKFFPINNIYYIKPKKYLDLHVNTYQSNFYFIKKGFCKITFIHPKYKDNFYKNNLLITDNKTLKYIKNNNNFLSLDTYENTIIYIPNYWIILIENLNNKTLTIECIQYKNIFDNIVSFKKSI